MPPTPAPLTRHPLVDYPLLAGIQRAAAPSVEDMKLFEQEHPEEAEEIENK